MTPEKQTIKREKMLNSAYSKYKIRMNSYALFKVNDHAMGEDLIQETFIKTWRYLIKGGKIRLMKPFLYHILNQLIIDEYRRRDKRKVISLDSLMEKGFEPGFDHSKIIVNTFDTKLVLLLIQELPVKYEKVIHMRYVKGLSLKEISLITGQSKNTVAVQAHRGISRLRKLYKQK